MHLVLSGIAVAKLVPARFWDITHGQNPSKYVQSKFICENWIMISTYIVGTHLEIEFLYGKMRTF